MKKISLFLFFLILCISIASVWVLYTHDRGKVLTNTMFSMNNSSIDISGITKSKIKDFVDRSSDQFLKTRITFTIHGKTLSVSLRNAGISVNSRNLTNFIRNRIYKDNILSYINQRLGHERATIDINNYIFLNQITLNNFYKDNLTAFRSLPTDSKLVLKKGTIYPTTSFNGYEVKYEWLSSHIINNIKKHKYTIPLKTSSLRPSITKNTASRLLPKYLLASFSTSYSSSSWARKTNIRIASAKLNNVILSPGQIFEFYNYIGEPNASKGYQLAPVYINGKVSTGIGGGMCQVSTTLYNAALHSDLRILKRFNHALPVHYIPLGLDAAVAYGVNTLAFTNNTGGFLIIKSLANGSTLTFSIYGHKALDTKISTYSVMRSTNTYDSYRVVYKGDKKLRTDYLGRSIYK